ncbi:MAG: nickel pincer cofactor biosynthesis protein LarB, partial [Sedimentisphaerales bacterium]|nr:nickel pincer cofactor biosynthesis protein LarB [Sedimentisphaerales bacterium]
MNSESLRELLEHVKAGRVSIPEALRSLRHLPFEPIGPDGFARIDHHRDLRCGMPEVIYCPGKTTDQVVQIFIRLAQTPNSVLATRADNETYQAVAAHLPEAEYETRARAIVLRRRKDEPRVGQIALVSAGTSDIPVAEEARITADLLGQNVEAIYDVGVAGLHRLLSHCRQIQSANVVIVVAGMEGALASVVGGLVSVPVIAVPTSVGYGAHFMGLAPLLTMLNSCAAGVSVVNIDNGFAAGYIAGMINDAVARAPEA